MVVKKTTSKKSPKKSLSKKSPKKSSPKKSPTKTPVTKVVDLSLYNEFEKDCIARAQVIVEELKNKYKDDKNMYKNMGHLIFDAYQRAGIGHKDCKEFYDREHIRRRSLKEAKRAAQKK